jgi:hypothetical protein
MNYLSRPFLIVFLLTTVLAASCSSCGSCGSSEKAAPATPDASVAAAEPDTAALEAAKLLEEATKNAEILGGQVGFDRMTAARFLSSELEGLQKEVEAPSVKSAPRPRDDGKIDVAGVKRVLRRHFSELQSCYERALKADPALGGTVTLTIRIGEGGEPTLTRARSSELKSETTLNCMERASKRWSFPEPTGGTVLINKPYTFKPQI